MTRTKGYRGPGPEVVIVGFEEICPLGFALNKHQWLQKREPDYVTLALKMGILEYRPEPNGIAKVAEVKLCPVEGADLKIPLKDQVPESVISFQENDASAVEQFKKRWSTYIDANIGVRRLTTENCGWDPQNFQTLRAERVKRDDLTAKEVTLLEELGIQMENLTPTEPAVATGECRYQATIVVGKDEPFPFPLDFGGPLPTGWRLDNLGLPPKEIRKMNPALLLVYETAYRILLQSTLHPAQNRLGDVFDPKKISLHTPTGMGPLLELQALGIQTVTYVPAKPKQLSHSLANIILGYLAPALGIKGKISSHVGACESFMGGFGDAYRDVSALHFESALIVGYDWALTAVAYNGFVSNGALVTNRELVAALKKIDDAGFLDDPHMSAEIQLRLKKEDLVQKDLDAITQKLRKNEVDPVKGRKEKERLQKEKLKAFLDLPKIFYEKASMPFHKNRSGFVMSLGSGGCVLTTLESALRLGLPIRALVAGVGEKVPDGLGEGYGSIADLGDGVGDAFENAFLEAKNNYQIADEKGRLRTLHINDVAAWFAHGTSTPVNGYGERREIHRICAKYGRDPDRPMLITGDKEIGHRIGGNFPSEALYMLEEGRILPLRNYSVADPDLAERFPLTQVVGKAGAGAGEALALPGEIVAINGAGFGKINSNILLKRFRLEDVELSDAERNAYQVKLSKRLEEQKTIAQKIRRNEIPLVK